MNPNTYIGQTPAPYCISCRPTHLFYQGFGITPLSYSIHFLFSPTMRNLRSRTCTSRYYANIIWRGSERTSFVKGITLKRYNEEAYWNNVRRYWKAGLYFRNYMSPAVRVCSFCKLTNQNMSEERHNCWLSFIHTIDEGAILLRIFFSAGKWQASSMDF